MKRTKLILILLLFLSLVFAQQSRSLENYLKWLSTSKDLRVENAQFTVKVKQPLDHFSKKSEMFEQRIFVKHVGFDRPVVIVTEGYDARPGRGSELTQILKCNEIVVEHRFFAESKPAKLDWNYLTVQQSAADLHQIVELFKKYYKGKWINTGISKGGQTTLIHRYFYPNDVDVSVPYVAPLNLSVEDERIYNFLDNVVGTKEQRDKVTEFQRLLLQRRDDILPILKTYSDEKKFTFRKGIELSYEYMVMEFSFGFWQWGNGDVSGLPKKDASAKELFDALLKSGGIDFFADQSRIDDPFNYQAYYQLGFYGYKTEKFKDLLKHIKGNYGHNREFVSQDVPPFDGSVMHKMNEWIKEKGNNILYIYGEYDTWNATAVEPGNKTNALKMVLPKGNHGTRIKHFTGDDKGKIYSTLEKWLEIKIDR